MNQKLVYVESCEYWVALYFTASDVRGDDWDDAPMRFNASPPPIESTTVMIIRNDRYIEVSDELSVDDYHQGVKPWLVADGKAIYAGEDFNSVLSRLQGRRKWFEVLL